MVDDSLREVTLRRVEFARHEVTNSRGGTMILGSGDDEAFSPVELLLAAVAGCSGLDVDFITSRRAEPDTFEMTMRAHKIRDELGNRLIDLQLAFDVHFPEGEAGDKARAALPTAIAASQERLCTVSRTLAVGTPVTVVDP